MKRMSIGIGLVLTTTLLSVSSALAGMVTYPLNLSTSLGNPVTDILILESDGTQVHADVYPSDLPGAGPSVINHAVPFTPVQTLVIGLTAGTDGMGNDKTQLVMLLDNNFAAAHAGIPFSSVFPGARHNETIANLEAAVVGDAAKLAWFTDTFFSGPAAGAAFTTGGAFTVAEFTVLTVIGASAAAGNWMITGFQGTPDIGGPATGEITEIAKIDLGPFDISVMLSGTGLARIVKTVTNNTGVPWIQFRIELGTGSGAGFTPAMGGLFFPASPISETTGAFPDVEHTSNVLVFRGSLPPGDTANFVFDVQANATLFTLRQSAVAGPASVPTTSVTTLLAIAAALCGLAAYKLRRASPLN